MSIRRRLVLSFVTILALFAANLGVYFWGNHKRKNSVEELRRAIASQILLASIDQQLNNVQKHVALLSQIMGESATAGADPAEVAEFDAQLQDVAREIAELKKQTDPRARAAFEEFSTACDKLAASWRIFYANFGKNQAKAIGELVMRGEPLSQEAIKQLLPQLQQSEKNRVKASSDNFYSVERLTNEITVGIFAISILIALGVAYRLAHYLTSSLGFLKMGADLIAGGSFNYRIPINSTDELGVLAIAYNEMAENLYAARKEMTLANLQLERRNEELDKQRRLSESLLLNILPAQVADELRAKDSVDPKYFEDVTIIFTDFVGFTLSTEKLAAEDLVHMLHDYFTAFDNIIEHYGLEKLKTIGDSYMCVGGLPLRNPSHPVDAVLAAFEMLRAVRERDTPDSQVHWKVRIGIHTGAVIAGVVGIQKFAFDVWGDTVNYASRMESSGLPNRINLSAQTHARVKDFFECEHRGKVLTKDKRELDMYFANGILPSLIGDSSQCPPPAFLRRYQIYFQRSVPAFPASLLQSAVGQPRAPA